MHVNLNLLMKREAENREKRANAILTVGVLLLCALILFTRFVWLFCVEVEGDSMNDTLITGDLLLVDRLAEPKRGDVIVFRHENKDYIKRVIAVGGDVIKIYDGEIYVKRAGESQFYKSKYQEKGRTEPNRHPIAEKVEYLVDENCYYVLGDNRQNSLDSRFFGSIKGEEIMGVVSQWSIDHRYTFWSKFYPYL